MNTPPDILKKILQRKTEEVQSRSAKVSLKQLSHRIAEMPPPRGFIAAIQGCQRIQQPAIIAEIKKASPSKGVLRSQFYPVEIAETYAFNGATCLSVLTDKDFFQGSEEYLIQVSESCDLPILRKDFIVDAYQVYESRAIGADCILLIVSALGDVQLRDLADLATHLDLDVLIEVHDEAELERALALKLPLIGINNRNLRTFEVSIETTLRLLPLVPDKHLIISESGITTKADVQKLSKAGVHGFLIGETFMKADDPGEALAALFNF